MNTLSTKLVNLISPSFRRRRFVLFRSLFLKDNKKIKILDVGGTQKFWEPYKSEIKNCQITILNLTKIPITLPHFKSVVGDARNMSQFRDKEFDVVFSNSVIEHVGDWEDQKRMAKEIQRVGKHYFIQTPNYYFPIEPHFLFPFFQYLPMQIKVFLIRHFTLGWRQKTTHVKEAKKQVNSIHLLKKKEIKQLFLSCNIVEEKFVWYTKSFIIYK